MEAEERERRSGAHERRLVLTIGDPDGMQDLKTDFDVNFDLPWLVAPVKGRYMASALRKLDE